MGKVLIDDKSNWKFFVCIIRKNLNYQPFNQTLRLSGNISTGRVGLSFYIAENHLIPIDGKETVSKSRNIFGAKSLSDKGMPMNSSATNLKTRRWRKKIYRLLRWTVGISFNDFISYSSNVQLWLSGEILIIVEHQRPWMEQHSRFRCLKVHSVLRPW